MKATTYGIKFDPIYKRYTIELIARSFDDDGTPKKWAIVMDSGSMSRYDGKFYFEPSPSNRDNDFYTEFRFDSKKEAMEFYNKYHDAE